MALECLLVSCDQKLLGQAQAGLGMRGASLHHRQDSASAIALVSRRHLDGMLIDCDDVPGGIEAIAQIRSTPANNQTILLAVVNRRTSVEAALNMGADFALRKPIQPLRFRNILDTAVPKMEREHRRYFRYDVDLPVRFQNPLEQFFTARMKNVSECGMAIKLIDPVRLKGVVIVEFDLPSIDPQSVHAKAEVVWSDSFEMGLRFLYIQRDSIAVLQNWLGSLEGHLRFSDPA